MDERAPMGGGLRRLEPGHFKPQVRERRFPLAGELLVRRRSFGKHLPGNREAFPVHEVGRGRADVRLDGCSYRQEGHGKAPKPSLRLIRAEGN